MEMKLEKTMRKVLTIALGLIAVGAFVGTQSADAKGKGPVIGIGPKPPAFIGSSSGTSQSPGDPRELGPRPHPQPTDPLPNGGTTNGGVITGGTTNGGVITAGTTNGGVITGSTTNGGVTNGTGKIVTNSRSAGGIVSAPVQPAPFSFRPANRNRNNIRAQ